MTRKAQYTRLHFIHSQAQHNNISFTSNVQTFKYTYLLQSLPTSCSLYQCSFYRWLPISNHSFLHGLLAFSLFKCYPPPLYMNSLLPTPSPVSSPRDLLFVLPRSLLLSSLFVACVINCIFETVKSSPLLGSCVPFSIAMLPVILYLCSTTAVPQ